MNIVIDSNILFSALIKDSLTRRLILQYSDYFLFPGYIFEEMEKYKAKLVNKSGMPLEDFDNLLQLILTKVVVIPSAALLIYRQRALELVAHIDKDDAIFIACALAYPGSILWSEDKRLKQQSAIPVLNTSEIKQLLGAM